MGQVGPFLFSWPVAALGLTSGRSAVGPFHPDWNAVGPFPVARFLSSGIAPLVVTNVYMHMYIAI